LKKVLIIIFIFFIGLISIKAQTYHLGLNGAYFTSFLFNKAISTTAADTEYVLTGGSSFGITSAFYFDFGGYYHRKIYGVKLEAIFANHNQNMRIFPGEGQADPNVFFVYKTKLNFIDFPLLFSFCPTHHQGVTFEIGPQLSFLQSISIKQQESSVVSPQIPNLSKSDFQNISFSGVLGLGIFYSFTENIALSTTLRGGYGFTDLRRRTNFNTVYYPTYRFWTGINLQLLYKINKYDSNRNRGYKYYLKHSR
jgi:hypothetical protein